MKTKTPYTPTRTCPHRWCKPLHLLPVPFVLAVVAFDLWHNLLYLAFVAISIIAALVAGKVVHFRPRQRSRPATLKEVVEDIRDSPGLIDLEMEDARYEGTGWRVLEVRRGWARAAVGCDIFFVLLGGICSAAVFSDPTGAAKSADEMGLDASTGLSVLIGTTFFAFSMYAHKKATQPRKPKKAWLPAFVRTNN